MQVALVQSLMQKQVTEGSEDCSTLCSIDVATVDSFQVSNEPGAMNSLPADVPIEFLVPCKPAVMPSKNALHLCDWLVGLAA